MNGTVDFGTALGIVPLLCLCLLALVGVMTLHRISMRLARIEHQLARRKEGGGMSVADKPRKSRSSSGDFERFLLEDPARRALPKKEQFAAYRTWRKEKGLSWGSREQEMAGEKEPKP